MQSRSLAQGIEVGSIERELFIDASPEVVFEVVSDPRHVMEWWADTATHEPVAGSTGTLTFGAVEEGGKTVALSVVEASPPTTFSFRWTQESGEIADVGTSLLVTFELVPSGAGALLRFTETGFRDMGWEAAVLEEQYRNHVTGWDYFLPRLVVYVAGLVSTS